MKQTAVEWLVEQFNLQAYIPHIEQAKEMEKQQIIDAYQQGFNNAFFSHPLNKEQYYNETYKTK
jgi:hypothetical protein